jgi:hypothetical protein
MKSFRFFSPVLVSLVLAISMMTPVTARGDILGLDGSGGIYRINTESGEITFTLQLDHGANGLAQDQAGALFIWDWWGGYRRDREN